MVWIESIELNNKGRPPRTDKRVVTNRKESKFNIGEQRWKKPPTSATPGRKPGTSTKVTRGILKALQNRTNLAAFTLDFEHRHPACT